MELYTSKKRWKWLLFLFAAVIFLVIIFYSNKLIKNVAQEERRRMALWADAISYRAELVNHTEQFFDQIRIEEGKRALILGKAWQKVNEADLNEDVTFYVDIMSYNSTIPCILTDENGNVNIAVNVDPEVNQIKNIAELQDKSTYDSVVLQYYKDDYNVMYYRESQIYTNLRSVIDNLVQQFFQEVVINSASVPVIVTDATEQKVIASGGFSEQFLQNPELVAEEIENMKSQNEPIKVDLPEQGTCYVFFEESSVLKQLRFFPFFQFFIVFIFAGVAYLLFSYARKSEQNQVWVGMSKETAHQLGTPISSLMAWNELLKEQDVDQGIISEIDKDVHRLETIAQRFSKISSVPELKNENIITVIDEFVAYLQTRISSRVSIKFNKPESATIMLPLNRYLFEWVIENICKNAVDAMDGKGVIVIDILENDNQVLIDIADTGKGIPTRKFKTIFKPGFTSKSRGWGLGLTLAKRIIEEYHKGKLFVKSSVLDRGTTMRIILNK